MAFLEHFSTKVFEGLLNLETTASTHFIEWYIHVLSLEVFNVIWRHLLLRLWQISLVC